MNSFAKRFCSLIFGLSLCAVGIVLSINANIGYAPWEVLHVGISKHLGVSIGLVSIGVGLIICLVVFFLGEKLGIGTLLNIFIIGVLMDIIFALNIIPVMENLWLGILMLIGGLFFLSLGSYFYISSGFGAGPRDSFMALFKRRSNLPIGLCRSIIEGTALLAGYFLGGQVGIGTVIAVFGIGFCIQIVFNAFNFNPSLVEHETFRETINSLRLSLEENK